MSVYALSTRATGAESWTSPTGKETYFIFEMGIFTDIHQLCDSILNKHHYAKNYPTPGM
jgi:hypothetical protein